MSYRLSLERPAPDAVRAVARERAEHALGVLRETAPDDPATAVHDVRKDTKKLRALLRLLQPAIDPGLRRGENRAIAAIAQRLSGSRDAEVLAGLAADLRERAVGQAPETTFIAVHDALASRVDADGGLDGQVPAAAAQLEALAERIDTWPLDEVRPRTLVAGLERSYRRGRDDLERVRRRPGDPERLHEWRKRVKDLWYQENLVRDAWPDVIEAHADERRAGGAAGRRPRPGGAGRVLAAEPDGVGAGIASDLQPVVARSTTGAAICRSARWPPARASTPRSPARSPAATAPTCAPDRSGRPPPLAWVTSPTAPRAGGA